MWFEQRLKWWRCLILSWHVVLKYVKDQILAVDTPGQHAPQRVRYGTACLQIRNVICCVSCSVEWELTSLHVSYFVIRLSHMVQEGPFAGKSLALQAGPFARESIAKQDILL
jgi:hypothetical protein